MKIKEDKTWPNETRLEMIRRSEMYQDDERIYQYGYYDGFQKAIEYFNHIKK